MRVVVLNDKKPERDAIVRVLTAASLVVEAVADPKAAVAAITRTPTSVVLLSWPGHGGADLVRLLRGADASGQMYIVALLEPTAVGCEVAAPLAAGVHDFLRRPITEAELVARVQAPVRLVKWARSVTNPTVFDLSTSVDLSRLAVWRNAGVIVAEDLGQMVGQPFTVTTGWPKRFTTNVRGATIPMSLASDKVEMRVSIVADAQTLKWLGAAVLGNEAASAADLDDALREFANTAGGAIKRAALPESITLTTGLPVSEAVPFNSRDRIQSFTLELEGDDVVLAVVSEIRNRENQRVPAAGLCEGMIVVNDVRSESGALLVAAGARLTTIAAERLKGLLGPKFVVEVAHAA